MKKKLLVVLLLANYFASAMESKQNHIAMGESNLSVKLCKLLYLKMHEKSVASLEMTEVFSFRDNIKELLCFTIKNLKGFSYDGQGIKSAQLLVAQALTFASGSMYCVVGGGEKNVFAKVFPNSHDCEIFEGLGFISNGFYSQKNRQSYHITLDAQQMIKIAELKEKLKAELNNQKI